ncbi:unnamed protein product [Brassica oleracea var. botrytis]|uniref:Coatomer beta subunit appendage platform domain-containing protein n=2 Tax=Brassica TaxID=3705 RepID=A0A3P6ET98_BRAOL|nr:unnamed protein product [Brassica napus]VDD48343.1 unnamed protein product [Brassica oleracea]
MAFNQTTVEVVRLRSTSFLNLEFLTRRCSFKTSISHRLRYVKRAEHLLQSHHCVSHILARTRIFLNQRPIVLHIASCKPAQQPEQSVDKLYLSNLFPAQPISAIEGECGFLSANLYAKSVFGEDALVNVSIEKQTDGALSGYIRIRSYNRYPLLSLVNITYNSTKTFYCIK